MALTFTTNYNGPTPAPQTETLAFGDCDTLLPTTDAPTTLTVTSDSWWCTALRISSFDISVSVDPLSLNVGVYTGTVDIGIPDADTCTVGETFPITVTFTITANPPALEFFVF